MSHEAHNPLTTVILYAMDEHSGGLLGVAIAMASAVFVGTTATVTVLEGSCLLDLALPQSPQTIALKSSFRYNTLRRYESNRRLAFGLKPFVGFRRYLKSRRFWRTFT